MGAPVVAKKKPELKLTAVKIEVALSTQARLIAARQGKPLATYLSDLIRPGIERDWTRIVRETQKREEGSE
jgi:hypothetical protein